jgi:hypothetical protein
VFIPVGKGQIKAEDSLKYYAIVDFILDNEYLIQTHADKFYLKKMKIDTARATFFYTTDIRLSLFWQSYERYCIDNVDNPHKKPFITYADSLMFDLEDTEQIMDSLILTSAFAKKMEQYIDKKIRHHKIINIDKSTWCLQFTTTIKVSRFTTALQVKIFPCGTGFVYEWVELTFLFNGKNQIKEIKIICPSV